MTKPKPALSRVVDAVDLEAFLLCESEEEAKRLSLQLLEELGFENGDIINLEFTGAGARVRLRGNVYKPGDKYHWYEK